MRTIRITLSAHGSPLADLLTRLADRVEELEAAATLALEQHEWHLYHHDKGNGHSLPQGEKCGTCELRQALSTPGGLRPKGGA